MVSSLIYVHFRLIQASLAPMLKHLMNEPNSL